MNDDYSEGWLDKYESRTQYYSEAANLYRKNQEPIEPVEIDLEETTEASNLFDRVVPGYEPVPSPTAEGVRPEPTEDDMVGSIMDIIHPQRDRDDDFMEGVSGFVKDIARPLMESPVARGVAGGVRDAAQGVFDLGQDMEGLAHLGYISYGPEGFGYDKELPEGVEPIRLPDFDDNGIIKPVPLETGLNDEEMLKLQSETEAGWSEVLPGLSRDQYAELASEAPGLDPGAAKESELQSLRERVQETGETPTEALRGLWGDELADAPRRLRQAADGGMAVSGVSSKAPQRGGVEGIVRGLTQFMTVFAGAGGMKQGASFLKQITAGGIADASFDPELGNLSTFLRELDVDNELTQFLDSKVGEDAETEERLAARAKQALEGAGLAMIVPPLIGAFKWAKAQNYDVQIRQLLDKGSEIATGGLVKEAPLEKSMVSRGELKAKSSEVDKIATEIKKNNNLKSFDLIERGDSIKLDMLEVEKEGRKQGAGSKAMKSLVEYADANGKQIILTPGIREGSGTTSKNRLIKFYKRFGFVENKGKNVDHTISESMYREPK